MKLKKGLFTLLFFLLGNLYAHDYHFAYMELEYYPTEKVFQATLKVTAHDLAYITSRKYGKDFSLDNILKIDSLRTEIETLILNGFSLFQNNQIVYFKVDGFELNDKGELSYYLSSEIVEQPDNLSFSFPLLSSYFPDQQNKVDYLKNGKYYSLTFLNSENIKVIPSSP